MGEYFKGNFGIFTEWVLTPGNFAQLAPNAPRAPLKQDLVIPQYYIGCLSFVIHVNEWK